MAIKGKRRARGGRPVGAAPRPVIVLPRKPLLQRRGFRIGLAVFLAAALGGGVAGGLLASRSGRQVEREREAVQQFSSLVEASLVGVGQSIGPSQFLPFPELLADVDGLRTEEVRPRKAIRDATTFADAARAAYTRIEEIDSSRLAREQDLPLSLVEAQQLLVQSLKIYEQLAVTLRMAAEAGAEEREDLLLLAEQLIPVAADLFDSGYQKLNNERARLGLVDILPLAPPEALGG